MARLHNVNRKPYQVSKKRRKPYKRLSDINGNFYLKKFDLNRDCGDIVVKKEMTKGKFKVQMNIEQEYMMANLVRRCGSDIKKMVNDRYNYLYFDEKRLATIYEKYINLGQYVEVDLREKYLKDVPLDGAPVIKEESDSEEPQIKTMDIRRMNRVQYIQAQLMQDDMRNRGAK